MPTRLSAVLALALLIAGLGAVPATAMVPRDSVRPPERPEVLHVQPEAGSRAGGSTVTITGRHFVDVRRVTFDGTRAKDLEVVDRRTLTVTAPPHEAGRVRIEVVAAGGTSRASAAATFRYAVAPVLTELSSSSGHVDGGEQVTLYGRGLRYASAVSFGDVAATGVEVVDRRTLRATAPAHAAGTVDVAVTTVGGSTSLADAYTYVAPPTATLLSPDRGTTAGGTAVTVTGTGFVDGSTTVALDGVDVPAGQVDVDSPTSITFTTPAHAAGTVDVAVTTPHGSSGAVPSGFTYVAPSPPVTPAPTTTTLSPALGPVAGGTVVTVTGTRFVAGGTTVTIGGILVPAGSVTVNSATSLTFTTPAHAAGTVDFAVTTAGGTATLTNAFTYAAAPTISTVSPNTGPVAGGTTVTLTGTRFVTGDTTVTIDGTLVPAASVTVNSATSLTFTTPAHAAGLVDVAVITAGGTATLTNAFTYAAAPTISTVSPNTGPVAGGTVVTLSGTDFVSGNTSVTIGGTTVPAASVTVNSATSLTFTTPAHAAGNVAVSVATPGGTSANVPGGYTYADNTPTAGSVSPMSGPVSGGTVVTLSGTNFVSGNTSVTIGGTTVPAGSVTVNSATSLTFTTPAHAAGNVTVSVTTPVGSSGDVPGGYTYVDVPTATSLSPTAGPIAGGTSVTITGTGFVAGDTTVIIGGTPVSAGSVTVNSATSLTFTTPAHAAGNVAVSVTTSGGTSGNVPGGFTYADAPTISSLTPSLGPVAGGTVVTVTGTGFIDGATTVTIGGDVATSVTVGSSTSLTFVTPAHAAGVVDVDITTPGGSSTSIAAFAYVPVR